MPDLLRFTEVIVGSLLNYVPTMVLALYPLRHKYRFSLPVTVVLGIILCMIQVSLGSYVAFLGGDSDMIGLITTVIYAVFYFAAIKAHWGKLLFTLLILSNFTNLLVFVTKFLEFHIFGPVAAAQAYGWTFIASMLPVHLILTVPVFLYVIRFFSRVIQRARESFSWNILWMIPASFFLLWFHHAHQDEHSILELAHSADHVIYLLFINLGSFFVYHTVMLLVDTINSNVSLEEQNRVLLTQNLQYQSLHDRIEETRRARHDLRHHITVIDSYLQSGHYQELKEYLSQFKRSLPDEDHISFCRHKATNALLLYFGQICRERRIDYDVATADVPEDIPYPENILTVLLGNLLENAVDAASSVTEAQRQVQIRLKTEGDSFFVRISNPYVGDVIQDGNGRFCSTKHEGYGLGLYSVRRIVEEYDGIIDIEALNGVFTVTLMLNRPAA